MVKPDITSRLVYLPKGVWYDFWTNKKYPGETMLRVDAPLETVPMFVRGGAIIPMGPEMKYVSERPVDPITFAIYPDERGSASTTLYEDDGTSPAYERGVSSRTKLEVRRVANAYTVSVGAHEGSYTPAARKFDFVIKSPGVSKTVTVADDGKARTVEIR